MRELFAIAILGAVLFARPGMARQETPPAPDAAAAKQDAIGRTGWLRKMYSTDRCTFEDACRAMINLVKGEHVEGTFSTISGILSELEGGIFDPAWTVGAEDKLTKGHLAYMLCKALKIQGGVTMRLTGVTRRYGLRECVYLGLIGHGTTDEFVSGRELIDVINKVDVYKTEGSLKSLRKP